ncbi:MAG: N-6 DNA methylase [Roseburia inulinivorans]
MIPCLKISLADISFEYITSNPPFGIDWKREKAAVEAEAKKGDLGRFAPGLPKISDGQQLFVLNGLSKLAPNGKMAIIQNGSPSLFQEMQEVDRQRLEDIFWKMTGWMRLCN